MSWGIRKQGIKTAESQFVSDLKLAVVFPSVLGLTQFYFPSVLGMPWWIKTSKTKYQKNMLKINKRHIFFMVWNIYFSWKTKDNEYRRRFKLLQTVQTGFQPLTFDLDFAVVLDRLLLFFIIYYKLTKYDKPSSQFSNRQWQICI